MRCVHWGSGALRIAVFLAAIGTHLAAQDTTAPPVVALGAAMTAEQAAEFGAARADFSAGRWSAALARLTPLVLQRPNDPTLAKFTAEAAINAGDRAYAIKLLQPIEAASATDWQSRILLARAYAEAHQDTQRDAEIETLLNLRKSSADPQFQKLGQFLIERVPLAGGHMDLIYSLVPWSRYSIYEMGQVFDTAGKRIQRITLESSDMDQALWAQNHAKEAAAGMRVFSYDGYTDGLNASGQKTQNQALYGFVDGRPKYNAVRERMLDIATAKNKPAATRDGLQPK